jgi:hypothetical protein
MYAYCIVFVNNIPRSPSLKIAFFNELAAREQLA